MSLEKGLLRTEPTAKICIADHEAEQAEHRKTAIPEDRQRLASSGVGGQTPLHLPMLNSTLLPVSGSLTLSRIHSFCHYILANAQLQNVASANTWTHHLVSYPCQERALHK